MMQICILITLTLLLFLLFFNKNNFTDADNRICVYTIVFGDYESKVYNNANDFKNADTFYMTDNTKLANSAEENGWNVIFIDDIKDSQLLQRYYKTQPHKIPELLRYDISVYMDGNIKLKNPLDMEQLINGMNMDNYDFVGFEDNQTIKPELKYLLNGYKKTNTTELRKFIDEKYKKEDNLLFDKWSPQCHFIVRNHNKEYMKRFGEEWYYYTSLIKRDQASFLYLVEKYHVPYLIIPRFEMKKRMKIISHKGNNSIPNLLRKLWHNINYYFHPQELYVESM